MEESDNASALEVLKKDYQETLAELSGGKAAIIEPFRLEYEHLYKALLRSHESENRLTKKIRDLSTEISASARSTPSRSLWSSLCRKKGRPMKP